MLHRLAKYSFSEWLLIAQCLALVLAMRVGIAVLSLPRLLHALSWMAHHSWFRFFPLWHRRYALAQLALLVRLAARIVHGPESCLSRSLLMFWLLKARGEPADFCLGVSKTQTAMRGHAWVELHGQVIGDTAAVTGRFAPLLRF